MSYAMALDNSWDILSEEEMYDVNGGWFGWSKDKFASNVIGFFDKLKIFNKFKRVIQFIYHVGVNNSMTSFLKSLVSGAGKVLSFLSKLSIKMGAAIVGGLVAVGTVLGYAKVFY